MGLYSSLDPIWSFAARWLRLTAICQWMETLICGIQNRDYTAVWVDIVILDTLPLLVLQPRGKSRWVSSKIICYFCFQYLFIPRSITKITWELQDVDVSKSSQLSGQNTALVDAAFAVFALMNLYLVVTVTGGAQIAKHWQEHHFLNTEQEACAHRRKSAWIRPCTIAQIVLIHLPWNFAVRFNAGGLYEWMKVAGYCDSFVLHAQFLNVHQHITYLPYFLAA